jgi:hypothetical protein
MKGQMTKFELGRIVTTKAANETISQEEIHLALTRHQSGDWGNVCKEDWETNDQALNGDDRILSSYKSTDGTKFWIITEHDRSVTTVLLPDDY